MGLGNEEDWKQRTIMKINGLEKIMINEGVDKRFHWPENGLETVQWGMRKWGTRRFICRERRRRKIKGEEGKWSPASLNLKQVMNASSGNE